MAAAFTYQPPARQVPGRIRQLSVQLANHPSNRDAAAIMGLPGYRSIERRRDGGAVVRFERFGRDADALRRHLAAELRATTSVRIVDH